MVDFTLTAAQRAWRNKAHQFAIEHIIPRSDLDTHGCFPWEVYQQAFDQGFMTSMLPQRLGGGGYSAFELLLAAEEFGYGDLGVATSALLFKLSTASILQFGTPEQQERWIRPLTQELRFAAHAYTEPEGSSNLFGLPATTTATPVDGGYLLRGIKSTISNAGVASVLTVFARIDPGPGGLSCLVVPRSAPGVVVSNPYKKMGQRAADTGEIQFNDVFVPAEDLIGQPEQGNQIAMRAIRSSRVGVAAMAVGVARRAQELIRQHGHARRVSNGSKLIEQQDYRFRLAEIEADIEMVRALCWRACWEVEQGNQATKFSSCAKLAGANMAVRVTNLGVEMLGAQGYLESGHMEKLLRDAKVLQIYEGPAPVQKMLIADVCTRIGRKGGTS
ncbi:MAG: acyl-CoA dehydrogenase family protein [Legionellales bacterium]